MTNLATKLSSGKKVFTAEVTPPKGAGIKKLLERAMLLKDRIDALNVTDCQRALVRMSSLAACKILQEHGIEAVLQMTCRDRNTIALQADLMGASALGVHNLLCLTGDPVKVGDSTQSKPVFEVETLKLLQIVQRLQAGRDQNDHKMNAPTKFFVGAVVNPSVAQGTGQLNRMGQKIERGAKFFQTQANYDLEDLNLFLDAAKPFNTKILIGVLVLHSYETAKFIHENIPGIRLPESLLERLRDSADPRRTGVEFAVETMRIAADRCAGFHLMTIREEELILEVMDAYEIAEKNRSVF